MAHLDRAAPARRSTSRSTKPMTGRTTVATTACWTPTCAPTGISKQLWTWLQSAARLSRSHPFHHRDRSRPRPHAGRLARSRRQDRRRRRGVDRLRVAADGAARRVAQHPPCRTAKSPRRWRGGWASIGGRCGRRLGRRSSERSPQRFGDSISNSFPPRASLPHPSRRLHGDECGRFNTEAVRAL